MGKLGWAAECEADYRDSIVPSRAVFAPCRGEGCWNGGEYLVRIRFFCFRLGLVRHSFYLSKPLGTGEHVRPRVENA